MADTMSLPATPVPAATGRVPGNKGIWVGICCEFAEFLVLFIVYFFARAHFPDAFHSGAERLSQTAGVAITLLMVSSSFFIACAPVAIVLTTFFGAEFARWASL